MKKHFLFVISIFSNAGLLAQPQFSQQQRYFPQFSLETGLFASEQDMDHNPSTGEKYLYSVSEYGVELGINCRISRNYFTSIWGNVGVGGLSMILLSQLKFGATFLYGDLTKGFAAGPAFALGTLGKMIGIQLCYKRIYIKGLIGRTSSDYSDWLLYSYSISTGYTFNIWPRK